MYKVAAYPLVQSLLEEAGGGVSNGVLQRSFINIFLNDLAERVNSMLMTWQRR